MTSTTLPAAKAKPARPSLRLGLTLLHLAVMGSIGWGIIGFLVSAIGMGIGLLFLLGVGVFVLLGVLYALFGIAWLETERVASLYAIGAHQLTWRPRSQPGFSGWLRSLGHNLASGRMWAALGNFLLASLMGLAMLAAFQAMLQNVVAAFTPRSDAPSVPTRPGCRIPASNAPWLA